ncbi:hypothetical protein Gogos_005521, partial [Gossypium gossypioides]|nr:hypothetical protein [Gossypium gossypioides]
MSFYYDELDQILELCNNSISIFLERQCPVHIIFPAETSTTRYVCCAGYICCSGKLKEKKCPEFCLCLEVACCFSSSVLSTRYLLQDEYDIKTTKCDNCIFLVLTDNEELEELAELLTCLSELTQHKIEMDHRHGTIVEGEPAMMIPPVQEMSRSDQPEPLSPNQVKLEEVITGLLGSMSLLIRDLNCGRGRGRVFSRVVFIGVADITDAIAVTA